MDLKKFFIRPISLIFLIFLLNFLTLKFYWYSSIWFFDMFMHFLGGVWLGVISVRLFLKEKNLPKLTFQTILVVALVGVGWEIFEISVDSFITLQPFNPLDSASDVFFDLSGGLFALFCFLRRFAVVEENNI